MLIVCTSLIVFAVLTYYGRILWARAEERRAAKLQSELALAGLKRIKEVKRGEGKCAPLRTRSGSKAALAATANAATMNPAAREIASYLTKKTDPNGPWQRGMRTY
jgi:hypothetical protein